jgi:predicted nucleic acid-binding protein
MRHLLSLKPVDVEDHTAIEAAISHYDAGLDFADALHHASYRRCEAIASFDDRKFARRAKRMGVSPSVVIPR